MNRTITLRPWKESTFSNAHYDAFIATVGYETRARFIAEEKRPQSTLKFACAFSNNKVHSYFDNLKLFKRENYQIEEQSDENFESWSRKTISDIANVGSDHLRLAIDISSMSRLRIAELVTVLRQLKTQQSLEVDFVYAPAVYTAPSKEEGPIVICKPVTRDYAGWSLEPEKPTAAVFGLGYEYDKALGALEYIEPGSVWAFKPTGEDPLFDEQTERANSAFCASFPTRQMFEYTVDQPLECFSSLESLVYGKLQSNKPILVPFGPKLFALNCLLVACLYYPRIAVWRVSSGPYEPPIDRISNGKMIGLTVKFGVSQRAIDPDSI